MRNARGIHRKSFFNFCLLVSTVVVVFTNSFDQTRQDARPDLDSNYFPLFWYFLENIILKKISRRQKTLNINSLSADNNCKQFRDKNSTLIWIQTICLSDGIPERIFLKS